MPYDFDRPLIYKQFCDAQTAEEREKLFYGYLSAVDAHYTGQTRARRMIALALTYRQALDFVSYMEDICNDDC